MRQRWFGAHRLRVPEIAVAGEDLELVGDDDVRLGDSTFQALVLDDVAGVDQLRAAHESGTPVVVRASTPQEVKEALARPEVACVVVPPEARGLRDLDLTKLTYG